MRKIEKKEKVEHAKNREEHHEIIGQKKHATGKKGEKENKGENNQKKDRKKKQ